MPLSDYSWVELSPHGLTPEERENPFRVIDDFFSYSHLPAIRQNLWELLSVAVTGNYCKALTRRERSDMLFFYEKLKKLIEAVSVIANKLEENPDDWKNRIGQILAMQSKE